MMNGASSLEGYVPDVDATIVSRILDAGGTIMGKVHCEYFCFSGGSHTSAAGPVHNPRKMGYSAGGSSSGSGADARAFVSKQTSTVFWVAQCVIDSLACKRIS